MRVFCVVLLVVLCVLVETIGVIQSNVTCGIRKSARDYSIRPMKIMLSSTDAYFPVLLNWLIYYNRICNDTSNLYIVCLDQAIDSRLPLYGLQCSKVYNASTGMEHTWIRRALMTRQLLSTGYDVLMTDTDAIWLRNPFPLLDSHPNSDIIGSRGKMPDVVTRELGASLCMGFVYVKSNPNTVTLWDELLLRMKQTKDGLMKDDQIEINMLLMRSKLHYQDGRSNVSVYKNTKPNSGKFLLQNNKPMQLTLLAHSQFVRECDRRSASNNILPSVVAHCLAIHKTGESKRSALKIFGVFSLKGDWHKVPPANLTDYLPLVTA